jgi:hypothetical protein
MNRSRVPTPPFSSIVSAIFFTSLAFIVFVPFMAVALSSLLSSFSTSQLFNSLTF